MKIVIIMWQYQQSMSIIESVKMNNENNGENGENNKLMAK
jgi:hypothetical protein